MSALFTQMLGSVTCGDCTDVMAYLPAACVDFVLTDPPYLGGYTSREGHTLLNDDNPAMMKPAFAQMYRLLKPDSFCVSFYGWIKADVFTAAMREAGFRFAGHIAFPKPYASARRFLEYRHESAYLLAKGKPVRPDAPMRDVVPWTTYTGNRLHPTQKPISVLTPLIEAFCPQGGRVLDSFCGSGSTLIAARKADRRFVGIELEPSHHRTCRERLAERRFSSPKPHPSNEKPVALSPPLRKNVENKAFDVR